MKRYSPNKCIVFWKTKGGYGGLSNMCAGYPIIVNGVSFRTSEALYQASRYPNLPEIQELIRKNPSPMGCKCTSKKYRPLCRSDWPKIREEVMLWCLLQKLEQNLGRFRALLNLTLGRTIVEYSKRDDFWGAKPQPDGSLLGRNRLGHLLMKAREMRQDEIKRHLSTCWLTPNTHCRPRGQERIQGMSLGYSQFRLCRKGRKDSLNFLVGLSDIGWCVLAFKNENGPWEAFKGPSPDYRLAYYDRREHISNGEAMMLLYEMGHRPQPTDS